MSDIEKVKIINDLSAYLNKDDLDMVINKLNLNRDNLSNRLHGLLVEDEFVMILHYLKCAKHIVMINESASTLTNSYQCDMLVYLNNGEKIFLEIKSKDELEYKISNGNLDNRISFANDFRIPLYFAVKFKNLWVLVDSEYLKNNNGKINIQKDFKNSLFSRLFNSNSYIFPKGIKVESIYSFSQPGCGILFPSYGSLISYKFYYDKKLIFEFDTKNTTYLGYSMTLEILHDQMANTNIEIKKLDHNTTMIIEKLDEDFIFNDYHAFISSLHHTINDNGDRYNSKLLLKDFLDKKIENGFIRKEDLKNTICDLINKGVPIISTEIIPMRDLL